MKLLLGFIFFDLNKKGIKYEMVNYYYVWKGGKDNETGTYIRGNTIFWEVAC